MSEVKIIGRGVDIVLVNVCYAGQVFRPIKQELVQEHQDELNSLQQRVREEETPVVTQWSFREHTLLLQEKGERGQWRSC